MAIDNFEEIEAKIKEIRVEITLNESGFIKHTLPETINGYLKTIIIQKPDVTSARMTISLEEFPELVLMENVDIIKTVEVFHLRTQPHDHKGEVFSYMTQIPLNDRLVFTIDGKANSKLNIILRYE